MVKRTLALLAFLNVAMLFPARTQAHNSGERLFNDKYGHAYLDKIHSLLVVSVPECFVLRVRGPFPMFRSETIRM